MNELKNELSTRNCSTNLIFHYTSPESGLEGILQNRTIRFGSMKNTNDPLEFQNYVHYTADMWSSIRENRSNSRLSKGREINQIIKGNTRILCASVDVSFEELYEIETKLGGRVSEPLFKGFCRARMWAQYASSFKGICLVFDLSKLLDRVQSYLETLSVAATIYSDRVKYSNELDGLGKLFDLSDFEMAMETKDYVRDNIRKYLFNKIEDYRDEREFRTAINFSSAPASQNVEIDFGNSLAGIVISVDFPAESEVDIENYAKTYNVPIFYLFWQNGGATLYEYEMVKGVRKKLGRAQ